MSKTPYAALRAKSVTLVDDEQEIGDGNVKFSTESMLFVEKYEIV